MPKNATVPIKKDAVPTEHLRIENRDSVRPHFELRFFN
ncbi:hypothetical protein SACIG290_0321 [Staphylococcus aureus subsp. aureus CIG290]|uniref:Uncharacterized protein n=1 Tax=Staphylococcus aureus TaxID=1280 RepID=D2JDY5_STAAU|nr:hypothetical protein SAP058A_021 [Staphylococcus aureus]EHT72421.1 hypothetical protein SACIG290_0321 [Staphylococcus aureus subsp. aureus CIG290]